MKEKLGTPATISLTLHGVLFALAIFPMGFSKGGTIKWGKEGTGEGTSVVTLTERIPMPSAPKDNPLATDTKTVNPPEKIEPKANKIEPPPSKDDYEIVDKKTKKQRELRERELAMAMAKDDLRKELNSIPGGGGRAGSSQLFTQPQATAGSGGIGFGGDFGTRYGWYVRQVSECLSRHFDRSAGVRVVNKVFVGFDIQKDGTITGEKVTTSSGAPPFDTEAIKAVQACSGRSGLRFDVHLPKLPSDFEGSHVGVEVFFDPKQ